MCGDHFVALYPGDDVRLHNISQDVDNMYMYGYGKLVQRSKMHFGLTLLLRLLLQPFSKYTYLTLYSIYVENSEYMSNACQSHQPEICTLGLIYNI